MSNYSTPSSRSNSRSDNNIRFFLEKTVDKHYKDGEINKDVTDKEDVEDESVDSLKMLGVITQQMSELAQKDSLFVCETSSYDCICENDCLCDSDIETQITKVTIELLSNCTAYIRFHLESPVEVDIDKSSLDKLNISNKHIILQKLVKARHLKLKQASFRIFSLTDKGEEPLLDIKRVVKNDKVNSEHLFFYNKNIKFILFDPATVTDEHIEVRFNYLLYDK